MRGVQGSRAYNANGMRRGGIVLYQGILTKRKGQSHETRFCKLVYSASSGGCYLQYYDGETGTAESFKGELVLEGATIGREDENGFYIVPVSGKSPGTMRVFVSETPNTFTSTAPTDLQPDPDSTGGTLDQWRMMRSPIGRTVATWLFLLQRCAQNMSLSDIAAEVSGGGFPGDPWTLGELYFARSDTNCVEPFELKACFAHLGKDITTGEAQTMVADITPSDTDAAGSVKFSSFLHDFDHLRDPLREQGLTPDQHVAMVTKVIKGAALDAGIENGMVVLSVNGKSMDGASFHDVISSIKRAKKRGDFPIEFTHNRDVSWFISQKRGAIVEAKFEVPAGFNVEQLKCKFCDVEFVTGRTKKSAVAVDSVSADSVINAHGLVRKGMHLKNVFSQRIGDRLHEKEQQIMDEKLNAISRANKHATDALGKDEVAVAHANDWAIQLRQEADARSQTALKQARESAAKASLIRGKNAEQIRQELDKMLIEGGSFVFQFSIPPTNKEDIHHFEVEGSRPLGMSFARVGVNFKDHADDSDIHHDPDEPQGKEGIDDHEDVDADGFQEPSSNQYTPSMLSQKLMSMSQIAKDAAQEDAAEFYRKCQAEAEAAAALADARAAAAKAAEEGAATAAAATAKAAEEHATASKAHAEAEAAHQAAMEAEAAAKEQAAAAIEAHRLEKEEHKMEALAAAVAQAEAEAAARKQVAAQAEAEKATAAEAAAAAEAVATDAAAREKAAAAAAEAKLKEEVAMAAAAAERKKTEGLEAAAKKAAAAESPLNKLISEVEQKIKDRRALLEGMKLRLEKREEQREKREVSAYVAAKRQLVVDAENIKQNSKSKGGAKHSAKAKKKPGAAASGVKYSNPMNDMDMVSDEED